MMSITATFAEHSRVMSEAAEQLTEVLEQCIGRIANSLRSGGTVLVCGNGGSAADAQHLAAELVCRFAFDRRALPALALTTDTSTLTAIANDRGIVHIFSRQVEALAGPDDILIAISTSGASANVVAAAKAARETGCAVIAMTGRSGGPLAELADLAIKAPSDTVARIQEVHEVVVHILAGCLEAALCEEHGAR